MKTYVIIDETEVDNVDFDQVLETSPNTLRYSVDGSKTFVKYEDGQPSFLWGKTEYTHTEILEVLATDEWTSDEPI
jgi:hypothetical protein